MVASQVKMSRVSSWGLSQAELRHETVCGHFMDGVMLTIGAVGVSKSILAGGGYWSIL
jgi:hypothetical protein